MDSNIVSLEGMEFYAYHGYYEEERKIGNRYSVDIRVTTDFSQAARTDDLSGTVNYETLYTIIKEQMAVPARLLERLALRVIERTFDAFSSAIHVEVSISKFNPPIGGVCARSKVTLSQART